MNLLLYDGPLSNFAFKFNLRRYTSRAVSEGDISREFKFRPRFEYVAAYSSFALGGLYDVHNDRVTQPFQGAMDQVRGVLANKHSTRHCVLVPTSRVRTRTSA